MSDVNLTLLARFGNSESLVFCEPGTNIPGIEAEWPLIRAETVVFNRRTLMFEFEENSFRNWGQRAAQPSNQSSIGRNVKRSFPFATVTSIRLGKLTICSAVRFLPCVIAGFFSSTGRKSAWHSNIGVLRSEVI
jgi:hypothetical protein